MLRNGRQAAIMTHFLRAKSELVRSALAGGGHLRAGPCASRGGDPTAVVGQSDRADHAGTDGFVLSRHPHGPPASDNPGGTGAQLRLVCQTTTDFQRCAGPGALPPVAASEFFTVGFNARRRKNPGGSAGSADGGALLCGIMAKVQLREQAPQSVAKRAPE